MLGEATFLPVLWSHNDTISCPSKQRTPSLKIPSPFGCWSIARAWSEPWIRISNNPRELGPDYMLGETNFLPILWFCADTISCYLRWWTPSLKLTPPDCWSVMSTRGKLWIGTSNNPRDLGPDYTLGKASSLIPYWYQFLSFKVKNFFTEASTFFWLLKANEHKKYAKDQN